MRMEVEHDTWYTYTGPVSLEPHVLRLRPRGDPSQRLLRYDLQVTPRPRGSTEFLDREGNTATNMWFEGTTERLDIKVRFEVETLRTNPFDFVLHPVSQTRLPLAYPEHMSAVLAPYRRPQGSEAVAAWARSVSEKAGQETLPFLDLLTRLMGEEFQGVLRREGDPLPPEQVLANRAGPCRDLTVLFMEACRAMGFAARFVSGYAEGAPGLTERELHAWPEVYLPGAGWRGWDPSMGTAVADLHVAVAAGRTSRDAAPLVGTFLSDGASGTLRHRIALSARAG